MRIIARHEANLMNRLDQVADVGFTHITKNELRAWYDAQRIGVNVWRDILEKWTEVIQSIDKHLEQEEKGCPIFCAETEGGYTFIWGQGLTAKASWFQNLKDWT